MLFSPDLYENIKPDTKRFKESQNLACELRRRRDYLNLKMVPLKRKWANSEMMANRVSRDAIYHRFCAEPDRAGKQTADGIQGTSKTNETREGRYVCTPLIQQKVDQIKEEYCSRTFDCNVKSLAKQEHNYLIQFLQDEVFKSSDFNKAHYSAFEDAVVKGTGFLRTKLYDIRNEEEYVVFKKGKKGARKSFDYVKEEIVSGKGLIPEYVDVEDVIIDPSVENPHECFICSHLDLYEAQKMFPSLKNYFWDVFNDEVNKSKENKNELRDKGYILPETLSFYKVGKFFVDAYKEPDFYSTITRNKKSEYTDNVVHDINTPSNMNTNWFDNAVGYDSFNNIWGKYYFGNGYDSLNNLLYRDKYLLTEYYYWGPNSRYVVMIGDFILYDGPMIEPFRDNPLTPLYFNYKKGNGIFGKSLPEKVYESVLELNEVEIKKKVAINISSAVMMGVDESQLEDSDTPIEVKPFTTIALRNSLDTTKPMRPLEQIGIQNPGIELQQFRGESLKQEIEKIYPDITALTNQLPKEEIESIFYSRSLKINLILKTNAEQLSDYAHKVFLNKLRELEYFEEEGKPFILPVADNRPERQRAIFVRKSREELSEVFNTVQEALGMQYEQEVMMNAQQLQQDPETQQQLAQIQEQGKAMLSKAIEAKNKQGNVDPNIIKQLEATVQKDVEERGKAFLMQKASQMTPKPLDENMYISYDDISYIKGSVDIRFQFNKTKKEIQRDILEFVNFVNSNQLSQVSVDMTAVARQFAVAYDLNPSVVMSESLTPLQTMQAINSRSHIYMDAAKNAKFYDYFSKQFYNMDVNTMEDMTMVEKMKTQEIIKREAAKVANEGQSSVLQKSHEKTLEMTVPQEPPVSQQPTENQTTPPEGA